MSENGIRINKYLSEAGVCSRREADRLVDAGRVCIDGVTAVSGAKVCDGQTVTLDGRNIKKEDEEIYLAFYKPKGIVCTTATEENGEKISDAYEWNRSMKACRELERKFGLKQVENKRKELLEPYLKKADYQSGDVKKQVSNIVKSVFGTYRFQSFGEYSALLSCFNIEAKQVKGEFDGVPYNGIVYTMTDDTGKPLCTPIKSSLIGKRYGYEGLEKRIGYNAREYKARKWQPKIRNEVALAMHGCRGDRETFVRLLAGKGIDAVFRENDEGRIYGATFIDHKNREVYNGSRLGKEFSANAFERLFNNPDNIPDLDAPMPDTGLQSGFSSDMESAIEQAFGIFNLEANGPDPQEEALARRLQRKKKKKRRSRGIS